MKTNNKTNQTRTRVYKITEKIALAFFLITVGISLILPGTHRLFDPLFFGAFGICTLFALISAVTEPNTGSYCCRECGHIHVPEGTTPLGSKTRRQCSVCNRVTVHKFVMPDLESMMKKEN